MSDIAGALLLPDWPAPPNVRAVCSTRLGGISAAPFDSLNLGQHVNDSTDAVNANRLRYQQLAKMPAQPVWLQQVHGCKVLTVNRDSAVDQLADAAFTTDSGVVATVMTADCLPLLLCDSAGTQVAAIHAGWRGLCNGVIEATLAKFSAPAKVMVYLGPAISQAAFEVGAEVRAAFVAQRADAAQAFRAGAGDKFFADLYMLARLRLQQLGVSQIYGGHFCTYQQPQLFFSYRRDGQTGRMASSIWLD